MSRFVIQWSAPEQQWLVLDMEAYETPGPFIAAEFESLLEAETYVVERSERSER